jgi:hypothetical protein
MVEIFLQYVVLPNTVTHTQFLTKLQISVPHIITDKVIPVLN